MTSHIPDKGQVMVRYYGLYANVHIYRSSEADDCGGEASAVSCFSEVALMAAEDSGDYF